MWVGMLAHCESWLGLSGGSPGLPRSTHAVTLLHLRKGTHELHIVKLFEPCAGLRP